VQLLSQRQDLSEEQVNQAIDRIESVRDNMINAPQIVADKAKQQYEEVTAKIGEYLRNTNLEELDPEGIKQDLTKLFENPKEGALALRERLSQVDRETLVKLLSQREDLSEEQINRTIDRVQDSLRSIVKSPRRLASRAQATVRDFQGNLENYLRNTNKEELNPESIKRDLQLLFSEPGMGMQNLGDRLQHFDRSTLVALLSQREDISEEEANKIADQIETVRNQFVEQVQRVQDKFQSALDGIFGKIRDYLNSLERPELNYEGIKRDFRKVFDDPQAGFEAIKERVSQFDRETLVAVISSRPDISEANANKIIDQIEGARDTVLSRSERLQESAKKRIKQLKEKAKHQAEEAREAAASAAWWLFGTALTSVAVSALAGAIAVGGISGLLS
jgi:cell shape-determining protein MreC